MASTKILGDAFYKLNCCLTENSHLVQLVLSEPDKMTGRLNLALWKINIRRKRIINFFIRKLVIKKFFPGSHRILLIYSQGNFIFIFGEKQNNAPVK